MRAGSCDRAGNGSESVTVVGNGVQAGRALLGVVRVREREVGIGGCSEHEIENEIVIGIGRA
jgi:hypothetical protein